MSEIGRSERGPIDGRRPVGPSDRIEIRGLRVHAHHGVYERERREGQSFVVDVALDVDAHTAARTDDLDDTIDYARLVERVADTVRSTRFRLLEALCARIADDLLAVRGVAAARVTVTKPDIDVGEAVDAVSVTVVRVRPLHAR